MKRRFPTRPLDTPDDVRWTYHFGRAGMVMLIFFLCFIGSAWCAMNAEAIDNFLLQAARFMFLKKPILFWILWCVVFTFGWALWGRRKS